MIAWHKGFLQAEDTFRQSRTGRVVIHRFHSQFSMLPVVPTWFPDPLKVLSSSQALEKVVADVPGCPGLAP